jgi:glucose-6-phosphate dehydrogenase assembly protein OpcA
VSAINTAELLHSLTEQRRNRPGVSTTTLNLIAFTDDAASPARLLDRLRTFAQKHPCRAIVLDGAHTGERHINATSTEDGDTVFTLSEEIVLGVAAMEADELHSIVHDLLIPDVGCALFWAGRELLDPRFDALASLGTTIVVDSSRAADASEALRGVAKLSGSSDRYLRDLSYLRLLPWQDMIAQFFDDAELARELPAISRVEIVSGSEPEAYYFAGWLASRLAWKPCGRNELCNTEGDKITVGIEKRGDPRRVQRVLLRSKHDVFCAELDPDAPDLVCLTVTGKTRRDRRCAPLHDIDSVSLVEQAVLIPRTDPVFTQALGMARAILDSAM